MMDWSLNVNVCFTSGSSENDSKMSLCRGTIACTNNIAHAASPNEYAARRLLASGPCCAAGSRTEKKRSSNSIRVTAISSEADPSPKAYT